MLKNDQWIFFAFFGRIFLLPPSFQLDSTLASKVVLADYRARLDP